MPVLIWIKDAGEGIAHRNAARPTRVHHRARSRPILRFPTTRSAARRAKTHRADCTAPDAGHRERSLSSAASAGPVEAGRRGRAWRAIVGYFRKMKGSTRGSPPRVGASEVFWSWVGSVLGIGAVALLNQRFFQGSDQTLLIGSFGASAVLLYGAPRSPLSQPRNLIGGHVLSALVGVAAWKLLHQDPWLAQAVAVATAIALMHLTKTLHPPGGATALIAVIGSDGIQALGYYYCLVPVGLGAVIMLAVAVLVNNIPRTRRYPETWF
jgi:hypothetical protein